MSPKLALIGGAAPTLTMSVDEGNADLALGGVEAEFDP